jgi:hypothetical protein
LQKIRHFSADRLNVQQSSINFLLNTNKVLKLSLAQNIIDAKTFGSNSKNHSAQISLVYFQ